MILLALGSNLSSRFGTSLQTLNHVLSVLPKHGVSVVRASRFYSNPAVPASSQPDFINCVVAVSTALSPLGLLHVCLGIERDLGRVRDEKWGPRSIDIDIVDFDGQRIEDPSLTLPHPRLAERAFVLVPLLDIAPNWRHLVTGLEARTLVEALDPGARAAVIALALQ